MKTSIKLSAVMVVACGLVAGLFLSSPGYAADAGQSRQLSMAERAMSYAAKTQDWGAAYHCALQVKKLADAGSESATRADQVITQAQAKGDELARQAIATYDADKMIAFVRQWYPSQCTEPVVAAADKYARQELDKIMVKPDPFPRYEIRNYLTRWRGVTAPACLKALKQYDQAAQPDYTQAMSDSDQRTRAKKLAAFILQWKPSSLIEDARAERENIADTIFSEIQGITDDTQRRRELNLFVRDFPDSNQVTEAREKLANARPTPGALAGGSMSGNTRVASTAGGGSSIVEALDHQRLENVDHQNKEGVDRQAVESQDRQNKEAVEQQTAERIEHQENESVVRPARQITRQARQIPNTMRRGRDAQQARSATQSTQATQSRQANQSSQATQARQAQQAR